MAQQLINVGILENDQTGDTLRAAFQKINTNFTELYGSSVALTAFSVGAEGAASGNGGLAYDNTTGAFTYTPPTAAGIGALTDLTGTGFTTLSDVATVTAADNGKILYYDHSTTSFKWKVDAGGISLTSLSVGVEAAASGDGSIAYDNTTGVFTYTPPTATGIGALTDLTGTGFTTLSDVDAAGAGEDGYILYYDHGTTSFKWKVDPVNLAYTDFSVNQNGASGAGTLTYNNGTGQFDYTPPDLTGFLTDLTGTGFTSLSDVDTVGASDDGKVLYYDHGTTSFKWKIDDDTPAGYNNANWDTAYGWGDHSTAGYQTASSPTFSGAATFNGNAIFNTGVEEAFDTLTGSTGTVTHDCDNGHIFYHTTPSANWTANFTNLGLTAEYATTLTVVINQGATAYIPTAVQIGGVAQTLNWQGGIQPTGTDNGIDVVSFSILNDGGTYVVLGQLVDFT